MKLFVNYVFFIDFRYFWKLKLSFCDWFVPILYLWCAMFWNIGANSIRKELCTLFCLVKVYGLSGVYAFFRIFVLSTSPYSEGQKFCNHFFKTYPYNPYSILFPSLTKGRRKYSWHYCTFCTIALSAKVRKCKSAKCKRYGMLHYGGWAGFNSSNSFSLLFIVGIFFSEARGFPIPSLKSLDSHQTKWQESRWRFDVFWCVLSSQSVKLAKFLYLLILCHF